MPQTNLDDLLGRTHSSVPAFILFPLLGMPFPPASLYPNLALLQSCSDPISSPLASPDSLYPRLHLHYLLCALEHSLLQLIVICLPLCQGACSLQGEGGWPFLAQCERPGGTSSLHSLESPPTTPHPQEVASEWLRGEGGWICTQKCARTNAAPLAPRWEGAETIAQTLIPQLLSPGAWAAYPCPP